MSLADVLVDRIVEPTRRRTVRFIQPREQLKLAAYLILVSAMFAGLEAFNSWSAYGRIAQHTLSFAPEAVAMSVREQTQSYFNTSLALLAGFVFCVLVLATGYVHRLLGPIVAFERQLRAMRSGNYSARITLRGGDHVYAQMADQLNQLAAQLQESDRSRGR
jgi:hypothetical protein